MDWKIIANGSTDNSKGAGLALTAGARILEEGGSAVDAVEETISVMEDDPNFDAGTGCDINLFGIIMMDASIMDGNGLRVGAIGAVQGLKNPIKVARKLMDSTPHVLLVGEGAEEFARMVAKSNQKIIVNYDARTEEKKQKFRDEIISTFDLDTATEIFSSQGKTLTIPFKLLESGKLLSLQKALVSFRNYGTVSASALDSNGNFAAGASTGGWTLALPGRIGDSPLVGCGAYADNLSGCSSTAGIRGEENIRLGGLTRRICDGMGQGKSAQDAVDSVSDYAMKRLELNLRRGSLIAIDRNGGFGFNHGQVGSSLSITLMSRGMEEPLSPL